MNWTVRRATSGDADSIAKVHSENYQATYKGILPDCAVISISVEQRAAFWKETVSSSEALPITLVGCEADGNIAGFVSGGKERTGELECDGELYAVYLAVHAQRRRLGTALVEQFAMNLRGMGYQAMGVCVLEANPNKKFYEALGGQLATAKEIGRGGETFVEVAYVWEDLGGLLLSFNSLAK